MKALFKIAALVAASASILACNKMNEPKVESEGQLDEIPTTKGIIDKEALNAPIAVCYVETNDVNPLNAGDYWLENGYTFFDIVELFASNIHKETVNGEVRPTLYLNDKLTNVLENGGVNTYIRPLQEIGIKVLLTVLGDWQGIGVANMTNTQADQFAQILAYTVERYGLDGIGFDDEYADYPSGSVNNTSYTRIITKLHELMPSDKLITVFEWGYTDTIDESQACPCIDYVYHGNFGGYFSTPGLCGDKTKWSPLSFNLGNNISTSYAETYAGRTKEGGYGAMMCFNLRTRNDRDALPVLQAMANGAYGGQEVTCDDGNRTRTAGSVPNGFTINYSMTIAE